jgi:hypothetical protein
MIETRTVGAAIADHQRPAFGFVAERRGVAVAIFPAAAGAVIAVADEPVERPPELAVEGRVIIGELTSYTKGKFIADHVFDEKTVSKQMGAEVILKVLEQRGKWP